MEQELLEAFKRYVDITPDNTDVDVVLLEMISYAESLVYEEYSIALYPRLVEDNTLTIFNSTALYVAKQYISSVVTFTIDGKVIPPADFKFNRNRVALLNNRVITTASVIVLTYNVGYTTYADVPKALINGIFMIAKKLWNDSTKDTDSLTGVSMSIKESIDVVDAIPELAQHSLAPFKLLRL
jgi:hypothetical protein